jgi:hypothetical protein
MMMKGPFRELIPVDAEVSIKIPDNVKITGVHLPIKGIQPQYTFVNGRVILNVTQIRDYEVIGVDLV